MSSIVEEYGDKRELKGELKTKVKTVRNLLKMNMPFETALEAAELDRRIYEEYAAKEQ